MYVLEYINTLRKGLPLLSKVSDPKKANLHFFTTFSYKKSSQKFRAFICKWHYICFCFLHTKLKTRNKFKSKRKSSTFLYNTTSFFSQLFLGPL